MAVAFLDDFCNTTISRGFVKKEGQIFVEGRLIVFDHQQIVASCGNDILAKTVLSKEGIGTDDASLKQNRSQEGLPVGQFIRFLCDHVFASAQFLSWLRTNSYDAFSFGLLRDGVGFLEGSCHLTPHAVGRLRDASGLLLA